MEACPPPHEHCPSPPPALLDSPAERAVAVQLLRFPEALANAAAEYKPNLITSYLWDLAKAYSGFFEKSPVLKAGTPDAGDVRFRPGPVITFHP